MNSIASLHPTSKSWLHDIVLAPHAKSFAARLERGRYSAGTAHKYLGSIAHLARWMTDHGLPVRLLDEEASGQFLGKHLPRCDRPKPVVRVHVGLRAASNHLLHMLREQGIIAEPRTPTDPVAEALRRYDEHMRDARGLGARTRSGRLRIVQRLLLRKFADSRVTIARICGPTTCATSSPINWSFGGHHPTRLLQARRRAPTFATAPPAVTVWGSS